MLQLDSDRGNSLGFEIRCAYPKSKPLLSHTSQLAESGHQNIEQDTVTFDAGAITS